MRSEIEMYLKAEGDMIQIPVIPSEFGVDDGSKIDTAYITKDGDHDVYMGKSLKKFSISSEFPSSDRSYCSCSPSSPYDYVNTINGWIEDGKIVRFIVTGTPINYETRISSFSYKEADGTRDIYYNLSLIEHIPFKFTYKPKQPSTNKAPNKVDNKNNRPAPKPSNKTSKTYTVKKGDCLWNIAKKYYGSGSSYNKIYNANKNIIKNPNLIYPGQKLVIP